MVTLDRSDGSATLDLYRAAVGPLHTDHYLKAFTRFDAAGKTGPGWNWSAALLSLNWLLLRQLWSHALAYVGALTTALLLFFGIGRLVFQLSDSSQWACMGAALLLACAIPGAWGNAWLYTACNQKMQTALAASATLDEACALLAQRASTRKHLGLLAAGNLALLAALAGLVLNGPSSGELPLKTARMERARAAPAGDTRSGLAAQNLVPTAAPAAPAASAMAPAASAQAVASAPLPAALPTAPALHAAPTRSSQGRVQAAAPVLAASAAVSAPAPASPPAPASGKFLVNVGLFADPHNARKAYAQLQDAGLPALSQEIRSAKGLRTRVRAGPFHSQAEAEGAAEKIRALHLDAVVFKP